MRRVYVLRQDRGFEVVAEVLAQTELDLARVVSCTFPGRPEPRTAEWTVPTGQPVVRYEYLPDIELRYVHVVSPDFSLFADGGPGGDGFALFFEAASNSPPFEEWPAMRADLLGGEHAAARRAAAAFAAAVRHGDDSVEGESELLAAVESAGGRGPEAAAEQLADVVGERHAARLSQIRNSSESLEVRFHLKRALDRMDVVL